MKSHSNKWVCMLYQSIITHYLNQYGKCIHFHHMIGCKILCLRIWVKIEHRLMGSCVVSMCARHLSACVCSRSAHTPDRSPMAADGLHAQIMIIVRHFAATNTLNPNRIMMTMMMISTKTRHESLRHPMMYHFPPCSCCLATFNAIKITHGGWTTTLAHPTWPWFGLK